MPSPTDAVSAALSQSLLTVSRKGIGSETNGESRGVLDSALVGANKLAEVTRHQVEYEPADTHQAGAQNLLKSKYIVLDTKVTNGAQNGNGSMAHEHSHNGTNPDLVSREFSGSFSNSLSNGLHSNVKNTSQNGITNGVNGASHKSPGLVSNSIVNGIRKPLCNGAVNGTVIKGSGNDKPVVNSDSVLPKPGRVLFDPDQVVLGWKGCNIRVGAGMVNLGNTCYLNATLQALFHIPAFVDWLINDTAHLKKCEQENGLHFGDCVICSMAKTFRMSQTNPYIKPYLIHNKLKMICRHFNHNSQEDAHEFMRHLLENMERSYLKRFKHLQLDSYSKETTPINQIFGGYIRTEVKCRKCNYASTTFQHFQDLILDIRKASKVEEAMDQYFSNETLDGENSYRCEKCKAMVMAHKKFSIERPPKVLCIQLKRFNVMGVKMQKTVEHRIQMDLRKYVHPKSEFAKQVHLPYRLISMVSHMGQSAGSGHYTAVALSSSGVYHLFDDAQVRALSNMSVLNHSAYILIYEMEPPNSAPKPVTTPVAVTSVVEGGRNTCGNGLIKNISQNLQGLPSVKDRDRVSFGLPNMSSVAPPRIIFSPKKNDSKSIVPVVKSSAYYNGTCNGETRSSSFIGPLQAPNGKHHNNVPKDKANGLASPKQPSTSEVSRRDHNDTVKVKEASAKAHGPLVPYECDEDSSSRESSLSPPSTDEKEMLTVTATTPRDWQVSSGLQSPSIHSESSNNSGASATGAHWNVTEEQPAPHLSLKKIKDTTRDLKFEGQLSRQSCYLSDTELNYRPSKSAEKSNLRAKSVERGLNLSKDPPYFEKSMSAEKLRRRKRSFSSESDASCSSKSGGKRVEVSDFNSLQPKTSFNKERIDPDKDKVAENKEGNWSGKPAPNSRLQPSESNSLELSVRNKSSESYFASRHHEASVSSVWNGESRSDTLSELKKMSHQGFGIDRVTNWNGERSQNSGRDVNRQDSRKRPLEEYEEELDRGREKKFKKCNNRWRPYNAFQNYHNKSWSFGQNYRNNRPYSNNHYQGHKNHSGKPYNKGFRDRNYPLQPPANVNRFHRQNHY